MRTSFSKLSLLALPLAALTACQDYEPFSEAEVHAAVVEREFTNNFESRYGKIDPEHNWGFDAMEVVCLNKAVTRAGDYSGAGEVYVRTNEWAESGKDEYIENLVVIPGYPNFDNYYYANDGQGSEGYIGTTRPNDGGNTRPCGDVTDYEVQYVSEFFRSHNKQQLKEYEQTLHLTDFFIQNVSAENDRVEYPHGDLMNNILGENCNFGMDHLVFKTMSSNDQIDDTWTHMNNYNRNATNLMTNDEVYTQAEIDLANGYKNNRPDWMQNDDDYKNWCEIASHSAGDVKVPGSIDYDYQTKSTPYNNDQTPKREIKYVASSGTEDFAYQSSWSTDKPFKKEWVLVKLTWLEVGQDGVERQREGYYLAFDYEAEKADANAPGGKKTYGPDGYYSNWIVKITPAYGQQKPESPRRRIMCEDLGNTFDFDFNDVVFDVYFENVSGRTDAVITLQAAGGTLPIFVGVTPDNDQYEAHRLLENSSSTPVNVGGKSHEIAIYRVTLPSAYANVNGTLSADDVGIFVVEDKNGATNIVTLKPATGRGTAIAPQKFCVPVGVRWMNESMQIETSYQYFDNWVGDKNFLYSGKPWYANANIINSGNLFNSGSGLENGSNSGHSHGQDYGVEEPGDDDEITFNWNENGGGTFNIPASKFANATNKIVITFTGNFDFQYAMPNYNGDFDGVSSQNKVLTITNSQAIRMMKAGTHNDFRIDYCANPQSVASSMFTITCE